MTSQTEFPTIGLKLTGACHLNCRFCCEPDRKQKTYSVEIFKNIITILKQNLGTKRICFTGGDPLLYPGIERILQHTKDLNIYALLLTSNGKLLNKNSGLIFPYIDAVRLSVHGIGKDHDSAVAYEGAFSDIEEALIMTKKAGVQSMITTVVTKNNIDQLEDIANWIYRKGVSHFYLFGLMKSGNGESYINTHGEPSFEAISKIEKKLRNKYKDKMEIVFYDYQNKAECILVYGDGRIVIDPCPNGKNFQQELGNIFSDNPQKLFAIFNTDPENIIGYRRHTDSI